MQTRRLGSQGPEISPVGFGAWEAGGMWGTNPPDDELIGAMRAGFDAGMNWIDTAEVYGPHTSEELVGRAVRGYPDVMVFTKLGWAPRGSGFTPEGARAGVEGSLRRIGRDVIDLYQVHSGLGDYDVEALWEAMARLVDDGLVRWIGVSNYTIEQIERCERIRHVDSLQPPFSLLVPYQRDIIEHCSRAGTGTIVYGPLAFGLLTGAITAETEFEAGDWRSGQADLPALRQGYEALFAPGVREKHLAVVERLRPVADRLGVTLAQLALAWCHHQTGVTGAIAGTRSAGRARENAAAGDVGLSEKDLAEIDALLTQDLSPA